MSTSLISLPEQRLGEPALPEPTRRAARLARGPAPWLVLILATQVLLTRVTTGVATPFEDEGLYIYMGHRLVDGLLHGTPLHEFPGSYFSGAPGVYPVLAALADDLGGLPAVRTMSLVFVLVATIGVYGTGSQLFGRLAGLLGAAVFAVCGSAVYQSTWATFDAMTMALLSIAAWLALRSSRRNGLLLAPAVAGVLALAVLTKYAAMAYAPFIVALAVAEGWPLRRWLVVRRGLFTLAATAAALYFVLMLWGRDLLPGIAKTTTSRSVIAPTPRGQLVRMVLDWSGPWLVLILLGAVLLVVRERRRTLTAVVLVGAALVGPAEQVRIGEATSLGKHLAFGVALAAPLAGYLLGRVVGRRRWWARMALVVPLAAVLVGLTVRGIQTADMFRTGYADDSRLVSVLRTVVADNPGRPILGEKSSPERYALRSVTTPRQWSDTYEFTYAGLSGPPAYARAIEDHYFGVIYLSFATPNAHEIIKHLGGAQGSDHYYNLVAKVPATVRGTNAGDWLVWTPQRRHLTPIGRAPRG